MTSDKLRGAVGQKQVIWPWTWYNVLKLIVEDEVAKGQLVVLAFIFWFSFPKYGQNPLDDPITQEHLNDLR